MPSRAISSNTLFYGDNLAVLPEHIPSESVGLKMPPAHGMFEQAQRVTTGAGEQLEFEVE